jgi:hypothetical protein
MRTTSPEAPPRATPAVDGRSATTAPDRHDGESTRRPALVLGAVVVLAAVAYGAAAQLVPMPVLNPDELRYTLAARALADGEWLGLRGHDYGYGPLYPMVLAPIVALAGNIETAYPWFKVANALLFALAAVPVYFLARRLLPPWWSVGVAATSVAIPSSIYASLVLTESAAYLTSSTAVLALVLALEHPTPRRQVALIVAVGLAYTTRAQFAAFVPAFLAGYLLLWALAPMRPRLRAAVGSLWPTLAALGVGIAAFGARPLLSWSSPEESVGGYGDLWRSYDLVSVGRFVVYHLAGLDLYLFVIPFAVAPIIVWELLRAARRGAMREGAFVATFLTLNAGFVLIAAAFASTPFGYYELHDRYLFYVAPLWLVVFATWLSRGLPRPYLVAAAGLLVALVLPALPPYGLVAGDIVVEYVPSALWSGAWTFLDGYPLVDGRKAFAAAVIVLAVAAAIVPRRLWALLPALVVAGFLLTAVIAWQRVIDAPGDFAVADDPNRTWVDDAVPAGSATTKLYLASTRCPWNELTRHALFLTEFFNSSIGRVAAFEGSTPDGLPLLDVHVGARGRLVLGDDEPLVADYVVTQPGIELDGRRLAVGTGAGLALWETHGAVRLADPRLRAAGLVTADCA